MPSCSNFIEGWCISHNWSTQPTHWDQSTQLLPYSTTCIAKLLYSENIFRYECNRYKWFHVYFQMPIHWVLLYKHVISWNFRKRTNYGFIKIASRMKKRQMKKTFGPKTSWSESDEIRSESKNDLALRCSLEFKIGFATNDRLTVKFLSACFKIAFQYFVLHLLKWGIVWHIFLTLIVHFCYYW